MGPSSRIVSLVLACAAALVCPRLANAGNEAHVRTPVLWPSECGRVVDRGVDPIARFEYSISAEDTQLTPDELPDSRTHQFFALCQQHALSDLLPVWITQDDVDRSVLAGLLEPGDVSSEAILDASATWAGCFVRITPDDARRPITFVEADAGVEWDTSAIDIGVWSLAGYTFEPPLNLWRDRPGFVKVLDDPDDPEQDLPALALLGDEQAVLPGEALRLDACVDVLEPARIELEWAEFLPVLEWQPLETITIDGDGTMTIESPAPIAAENAELLVRGRLIDALGRETVAHVPARMSVGACEGDCSEPAPPSDEARGCSASSTPSGWLLSMFALLLLGRRRARAISR